jgi:large subunit ribosomal protein L3
MQKGIIGRKVGMTQIFDAKGNVVPVTVVEAGPCVITQKKTVENDGYNAVQMCFGDIKLKTQNGTGKGERKRSEKFQNKPVNVTMPLLGHFAKNDVAPKKVLREFRLADTSAVNVGDVLKADIFAEGESVDVRGTSKGKGYAGVIKRWNFSRLKESHGTGPVHRHGGSLGVIDPARVFKGKKMAGHLGNERVTVQNLKVVKIDAENNIIAVKGAVPGPKGGIVVIFDSVKA